MQDREEALTGGNIAQGVVRIGETVRKPVTAGTPAVDTLLEHLHAVGYKGAPQSFGLDAKGRQVLEYIAGESSMPASSLTVAELRYVGEMIRELHDALSSFNLPVTARWNVLMPADGDELICHNDLAPWNLIRGETRWCFIDWDTAAPGTRLWDLAYAALTFPPMEPDCDLLAIAPRMRAVVEGYGLEPHLYAKLLRLMVRRARAMYGLLLKGHETGEQPWARLYEEGHGNYWGPVADYVEAHLTVLERLLTEER